MKAWRERHRERVRAKNAKHRLGRYGLTPAAYDSLHNGQGGRCAICKEIPEQKMVVDHCHVTGRVRGLLCTHCNLALGHFRDDVQRMRAAIDYLMQA